MANRFILNETSYFGAGARENLVPELTGRGLKKVMFVTDKVLLECGVATKVTAELDKAGIAYEIYSDVKAVSYTHLDVYKRQPLSRAVFILSL